MAVDLDCSLLTALISCRCHSNLSLPVPLQHDFRLLAARLIQDLAEGRVVFVPRPMLLDDNSQVAYALPTPIIGQ